MRGRGCCIGRDQRRQKRIIFHIAGNDHFHRKKYCCQRCLKQSAKSRCHTGYQHHRCFFFDVKSSASLMGKRCSDLYCHPFPSGTSAEKMGDPGSDHHQRHKSQRYFFSFFLTCFKHQRHPFQAQTAETLIHPDNRQSSHRQNREQITIILPSKGGNCQQTSSKNRINNSHADPHQDSKNYVFTLQNPKFLFFCGYFCFLLFHIFSSFLPVPLVWFFHSIR